MAISLFSWPRQRPIDLNTIPDFLSGHNYTSKLIYLGLCLVVATVARVVPKQRDRVNLAIGLSFYAFVFGWQILLGLIAVVLLIHYALGRLNAYLSMAITAFLVVGIVRVIGPAVGAIPRSLLSHPPFYDNASTPSSWGELVKLYLLIHVGFKILMLSFDWQGIRKSQRSALRSCCYCFGMVLGILSWVSYHSLYNEKSRDHLNRTASRQLYWYCAKILCLASVLRIVYALVPDPSKYDLLSGPLKIALLGHSWAILFLTNYAMYDLGHGLANVAGYNAPDACEFPFLAPTPIQSWRRMNVNLLDLMRRTAIIPVVRRFGGGLRTAIPAAMLASWMAHSYWNLIVLEPYLDAFVFRTLPIFTLLELLAGIPMEHVYGRFKSRFTVVFWAFFQMTRMIKYFAIPIFPAFFGIETFNGFATQAAQNSVSDSQSPCFVASTFFGVHCGGAHIQIPPLLWMLMFPAATLVFAGLMLGLLRLFPSLAAENLNSAASTRRAGL